jgi:protein-S-isoprenylcysteine O-methyltransferase Ste14
MYTLYFVILALCLFGVTYRTVYEVLKKAGRLDTKNKVVFTFVFLAMSLLLMSWPLMCPLDPMHIVLPVLIRGVGMGILIIGWILAVSAFLHLRGVENIDHLVTNGLFSKLRHPMYTGFMLWILGWTIFWGAMLSLIIGILCIANILYWRSLEEKKLVSVYGEVYKEYRVRTWF